MPLDTRTAWLALSNIRNLNASDATLVAETMGGPQSLLAEPDQAARHVFEAACARVGKLPDEPDAVKTPQADAFGEVDRKKASKIEARLEACGARMLWFGHEEYPPLLRHIPDAPLVLYARGTIEPIDELSVAVVGSRDATAYGLRVVRPIVEDLARHGVTIISGMARGLDSAAHRAALRAGGRTLAFLGTTIDRPYPAGSRDLYDAIPSQGAVLSEYAPGSDFHKSNFLARNRLIAGASRSLLVIEAGPKSGTSNTVAHSAGYARPVYAVPGDITTVRSQGTNRLIVEGRASPIRGAADLLEDMGIETRTPEDEPAIQLDPQQARVWKALENEAQIVDKIAAATGLTVNEARPLLTSLELAGHVLRTPSGAYRRTR